MPFRRLLFVLLGFSATIISAPARAQFDEEADLIPGLVAKYEAGGRTVERIDVDLSHDWRDAPPDRRLPYGVFNGTWSTGLLLREEGPYTFHAYLQGAVTIKIDGDTVLDAESNTPGWVSGDPIDLDFGLLELEVVFRKTAPQARMQLYWSTDRFPVEPLPPHQFFRDEGRPDLAQVETGRRLFAAHRCSRCHAHDDDLPVPSAPGFFHLSSGLNRNWLTARLLGRHAEAAEAKMPSFGFSEQEAEAVAAWIEYVGRPADLMTAKPPQPPKGDDALSTEEAAATLLHSVGCLACHTVGDQGHSGPFGGGDLSNIAAKRTPDWINTWLTRPERLNVQHRMPVFKLTSNERALLVSLLSTLGRTDDFDEIEPDDKRETDLVKRGRELAKAARCAACHKVPAMEADLDQVPTLSEPITEWDDSCLAMTVNRETSRPTYPGIDAEAVKAYLNSRIGGLSRPGPWVHGQMVLEQRNCLGCHERDLTKGIVPTAGSVAAQMESLRGQSQALIPPALTAVGDKLYEKTLTDVVRGGESNRRLPWLHVQMPRFVHKPEDNAALTAYLIGHDRIPDGAPASAASLASGGRQSADTSDPPSDVENNTTNQGTDVPRSPVDAQTLVTGRTLTGSGGFNCVACHAFGDYEPRNVALGTKGSDLKQIDQRIRPEFFHRWTRDPLRVVPGMEMPSIKRPVDGVLDGDLDKQLAAVWAAINDPDFTAPPNPAQVEQHIVLQPGDPPRIIRDVFTVSEANGGGYVARGIAMGFDNGHSLLFDVDNFCIRGWTFGDFAQQRTVGKSWYWDLAGVDVVAGLSVEADVVLVPHDGGTPIRPLRDEAPVRHSSSATRVPRTRFSSS